LPYDVCFWHLATFAELQHNGLHSGDKQPSSGRLGTDAFDPNRT
jgi:hypothetical protein